MKHYRRINYEDRLKIETLYNIAKMCPTHIARELGFYPNAIFSELKQGFYEHRDGTTWKMIRKYSAQKAQERSDYNQTGKGASLKIGNDREYAQLLEHLIVERKLSPAAALAEIRNKNIKTKTTVCVRTVYNYIDNGMILNIKDKDLPYRCKRKKKKAAPRPFKLPLRGRNIDTRPASANDRTEFGHWEFDTVVGKRSKGETLLVFTERMTRYELIFRAKDKSAASTVAVIDELETMFGDAFKKVFKTMTCDNGTEFSDISGMELSKVDNSPRTQVYFCHPFASSERGSNENQNRIIRRFIRKGTAISGYSDDDIAATCRYMNEMPRKLLGWRTAADLYNSALSDII